MSLYLYLAVTVFAEFVSLNRCVDTRNGTKSYITLMLLFNCNVLILFISCPTCREVCHITAENAAENIMIKSLAVAVDPDGYAARLAEALPEKESWTNLYPIFYYNNTMFPGGRLNLHLFEPRYKLMMQRIVDSSRAFAYVPNFNTYLAQIGDVALVAELKDAEFLAGILFCIYKLNSINFCACKITFIHLF